MERFDSKLRFTTTANYVAIGKEAFASPHFKLEFERVSRRQAELKFISDKWYVEDMGSDNGTWLKVDGQFVLAELGTPLFVENGAQILFGTILAEIKLT